MDQPTAMKMMMGPEPPPQTAKKKMGVTLSCVVCGKKDGRRCGRCRLVAYCSVACQKKHFKKHRSACDKAVEEKEADNELRETYGPTAPSELEALLTTFKRVEPTCELCKKPAPFDEPWQRYRACCGARLCDSCAGESPEQRAHQKMMDRQKQTKVNVKQEHDDKEDDEGPAVDHNVCFCGDHISSKEAPKPKKPQQQKNKDEPPCPFCGEVVTNPVERLVKRADEEGNGEVWYVLGYTRVHGAKKSRRDPVEGCKWLRRAARVGCYGALYELGVCHSAGLTGKEPNKTLAARMFKLAAGKGGHATSLYALATAYLAGAGVPKDSNEARRLLELGAAEDHTDCKTELAKLCIDGEGSQKQDRVRAAKLLGLDRTADLLAKGMGEPPAFLFGGGGSDEPIPDNEYTEEEMDEFFNAGDTETVILGPTDTKRGIDSMAAALAAAKARAGIPEDQDLYD